ncbi:MAG: hypothetical protein IT383_12635 [Deltaproteobacteria bacterium]|nr:hypothetical protein [Deltaproteobacteria bacterium]
MRALVADLVPTLLVALLCVASASARAQSAGGLGEPTVDASTAVDPAVTLGLGTVLARIDRGKVAYLALAQGGVAVVDQSMPGAPRLLTTLLPGQAVSRLLLDGDRLWAVVLSESAHAFSVVEPAAPLALLAGADVHPAASAVLPAPHPPSPPSTAPVAAPSAPAPSAKVLEVSGGRVIFDGGTAGGFAAGMHVKVVSQRLVTKPDLVKGGMAQVPSGEVTAVVAIEDVAEERAMAVLGRGDVAAPGDLVLATDEGLSESLFLPRRAPFHWSLGFMARPFLGVNAPGIFPVGGLVDGYARYTFDAVPIALGVEMAPMGFAVLTRDLHYPGTFALTAAYVTDYFEIGLGGGALVGNAGPCTQSGAEQQIDTNDDGVPDEFRFVPDGEPVCEQNNGATFNQVLRLGAHDGLHLSWSSSIFARPEGFVLGVGRGEVAVPVSSSLGLFGAGGVGESGWAFGEIGVRSLFGGTGAPGTIILSASLGVSAVFDGAGTFVEQAAGYAYYQREMVVGPAVGFGMEWRL